MSRRSRGKRDANAKVSAPPSGRPSQGPTIRRTAEPTPRPVMSGRPPRDRKPWEDACPVCGAEIWEEGGTGCCNAMVAECDGSIDGVPVDWASLDSDEESDRLSAIAVHHAWYLDTGEPAPSDYTTGVGPTTCRCGTPAH